MIEVLKYIRDQTCQQGVDIKCGDTIYHDKEGEYECLEYSIYNNGHLSCWNFCMVIIKYGNFVITNTLSHRAGVDQTLEVAMCTPGSQDKVVKIINDIVFLARHPLIYEPI